MTAPTLCLLLPSFPCLDTIGEGKVAEEMAKKVRVLCWVSIRVPDTHTHICGRALCVFLILFIEAMM